MWFDELARFLDGVMAAERFAGTGDPAGVWRAPAGERPVEVVGLALEARPGVGGWVEREGIGALVLHRPWKLEEVADPPPVEVGVLAYHLAFDERLGLGFNPWLAEALGLAEPEVLGRKEGRPLGMIGAVGERTAEGVVGGLAERFGGVEETLPGPGVVGRVAVVGGMTGPLVAEAARRGAGLYVTGQVRQPALAAVRETGIGVVAVGHRRSEVWGLRRLGRLIGERWPGVRVVLG